MNASLARERQLEGRDDLRRVGRLAGYTVAVVLNALVLYFVNIWPGWTSMPFLTEDAQVVVAIFNASLIVGIIVNSINVIADHRAVKAVGEIVTSAIAIVVLVTAWEVFPFKFDNSVVDWSLIAQVVLAFATAACIVSIIVQVARLIDAALRRPSSPRTATT